MTALKKPDLVSVEDFLAGEEQSEIPSLKVLLLVESDRPRVVAYRRRAAGGFEVEEYTDRDAVIALPEIEAELPFAELYDGITFA